MKFFQTIAAALWNPRKRRESYLKKSMGPNAQKQKHQLVCQKYFHGKAGAREVEAGLRIWQRFIDKDKRRYVSFIGDGDSNTHKAIEKLNDGKFPMFMMTK